MCFYFIWHSRVTCSTKTRNLPIILHHICGQCVACFTNLCLLRRDHPSLHLLPIKFIVPLKILAHRSSYNSFVASESLVSLMLVTQRSSFGSLLALWLACSTIDRNSPIISHLICGSVTSLFHNCSYQTHHLSVHLWCSESIVPL